MTDQTRRGPGSTARTSASTCYGTQQSQGYQPSPGERRAGLYFDTYLDQLNAKATTTVDPEAAFYALVDQLGDDRARALLFRRRCQR